MQQLELFNTTTEEEPVDDPDEPEVEEGSEENDNDETEEVANIPDGLDEEDGS